MPQTRVQIEVTGPHKRLRVYLVRRGREKTWPLEPIVRTDSEGRAAITIESGSDWRLNFQTFGELRTHPSRPELLFARPWRTVMVAPVSSQRLIIGTEGVQR